MMKKIVLLSLLFCFGAVCAQEHQLTLGAGGGVMLLNPQTEQEGVTQAPFPAGMFSLGYTYLADVGKGNVALGLSTGLEAGGAMAALSGRQTEQFTNTDYLGNTMQYTVTTGFSDRQKLLFAQVPLMFTMRASGLTLSLGAKASMPFLSRSEQVLKNPSISAYYDLTGVTVTNRVITGVVAPEDMRKSFDGVFSGLTVKASCELGYEWKLGARSAFGLKVFADVSVYDNYSSDAPGGRLITVAPITDATNPAPLVTVGHATELYCRQMLPVELGLKLYYAFVWNNRNVNQIILNRNGRRIRIRLQ